jgi:hypothetical protein
MDFELVRDTNRHTCALLARTGAYDGRPRIPEVGLSALPFTVHPDRAAVAAALLHRRSVAGAFSIDPGCSPVVASAIRSWFAPVDVQVLAVEFTPSRIPGGKATLHVLAEGVNDGATTAPGGHDVIVRVLREGVGSVVTPGELSFVSNAALLAPHAGTAWERALPAVAVALLFAEDLFADRIAVPGIADDPALWPRVRTLLDAAGLALDEPARAAA